AVANIIMYGGAKDDPLEIAVELERNGTTLVARVEDNGRQFDPTRAPWPVPPPSLEEAKVGDLGIHLMRSFASGMDYERRDGRNRLTFRFVEESAKDREGKVDAKHQLTFTISASSGSGRINLTRAVENPVFAIFD